MKKVFGLGECVEWKASQGHIIRGVIVKVLRANERPKGYRNVARQASGGRDHESYLVQNEVDGETRHYWPRVQALRESL